MAQLRYLSDDGRLMTMAIEADPFLIGRAGSCQLTFQNDTISREHVRIEKEEDGRFRIRDLGSRNKTHVNGQLITETLLSSGDMIRAGACVMEFLDDTMTRDKLSLEFLTPDRNEPPDVEWIKIKAPLSLTVVQLEAIARVGCDLGVTSRPEDIANVALGRILVDFQADRGFIALRGDRKRDLRPVAHRSLQRQEGDSLSPVSQSFVFAALLQSVAGRYPTSAGGIDAKAGYAACGLVAPLTYRGDVVGVIYIDRPSSKKPFPAGATQQILGCGVHLGALMAEAARKLVDAATRESSAWLSTLRRAQTAMSAEVTGSDTFTVATKHYPGKWRCGDFCDVVHIDEHRLCAVLVDGGGHGVAGLAQAAAIRAGIRGALAVSEDALMDPEVMLGALNRLIAASRGRQVVPCNYVAIDLSTGRLIYSNAGGMPPLLMVAPGRLVTLDQSTLVLGVDPDYSYGVTRAELPEKFRLVMHSDGLSEATNGSGEALGDQRLHEVLLKQETFATPNDVILQIDAAWQNHLAGAEPDDDATVLVIGRE